MAIFPFDETVEYANPSPRTVEPTSTEFAVQLNDFLSKELFVEVDVATRRACREIKADMGRFILTSMAFEKFKCAL